MMYIPNDDTKNVLNTQLNEPTNQNLIKVPKVIKPTNKKTLGTSVTNSSMSPSSLNIFPFEPPPPSTPANTKNLGGRGHLSKYSSTLCNLEIIMGGCRIRGGGQYKEIIIFKVLRTTEH